MLPDLAARALRKEYPHAGDSAVVLDEVSLELSRGESRAIMRSEAHV